MLEYDRKKLGTYLKQVRETSGLTQHDVSAKLGYSSPQFISNIERGISVVPLKGAGQNDQHAAKLQPDQVVRFILESQKKLLKAKLTVRK